MASFLQSGSVDDHTTGTTTTKAFASACQASSTLIAVCFWIGGAAGTTASVSDPTNGAWEPVGAPEQGTVGLAGVWSQAFIFGGNAATAGLSVTLTTSGSTTERAIAIHEYAGTYQIQSHRESIVTGSLSPKPGQVTPLKTGDFIFDWIVCGGSESAIDSGFTVREKANFGNNGTADLLAPTAGTAYNPLWTVTNSENMLGQIVLTQAAIGRFGDQAIEASWDKTGANFLDSNGPYMPSMNGTVTMIEAYLKGEPSAGVGDIRAAIYADNGSGTAPGNLIAVSDQVLTCADQLAGWIGFPIQAAVTSGTNYWIVLWYADAHIDVAANNAGPAGIEAFAPMTYNATSPPTSPWPAGGSTSTSKYSLFATYVTSTTGMTITNQTNQEYWFGPLHLPAGSGTGTLVVDDTDEVSRYRKDDSVADAINSLYAQTPPKITVTGAAPPFPRPTGTPMVMNGVGSPEGVIYAPEGTLYLRRDGAQMYQKTSLVHASTGWTALSRVARDQDKRVGIGYIGECWDRDSQYDTIAFTSGDCRATATGFLAGDVINNIIVNVTGAVAGITTFKVGVWDVNGNLVASSANQTAGQSAGLLATALSTPYVVPADGLYYLGCVLVATTIGSYSGLTGFGGKEAGIGSGPKGAYLKSGQTDIPTTLGTGEAATSVWYAWN